MHDELRLHPEIYSVLSPAVVQRPGEIGLHVALGAARTDVLQHFVRLGGRSVTIWLTIGAAASIVLARAVINRGPNAPALDSMVFVAAVALLAAVSLIAGCLPARRATKGYPTIALRGEIRTRTNVQATLQMK